MPRNYETLPCPICGQVCSWYRLDSHVANTHDKFFNDDMDCCAWCGEFLCRNDGESDETLNNMWKAHLSTCTSFAAWALAGVYCQDFKKS